MFKLIGHLVVFGVGTAVGVWWGVHHPTQAQDFAAIEDAKIQQAMALGKKQALQTVQADQAAAPPSAKPTPAASNHLQQMLDQAQTEINQAKVKLGQ